MICYIFLTRPSICRPDEVSSGGMACPEIWRLVSAVRDGSIQRSLLRGICYAMLLPPAGRKEGDIVHRAEKHLS